jgi:hypothetical protein
MYFVISVLESSNKLIGCSGSDPMRQKGDKTRRHIPDEMRNSSIIFPENDY